MPGLVGSRTNARAVSLVIPRGRETRVPMSQDSSQEPTSAAGAASPSMSINGTMPGWAARADDNLTE